MFWASLGAIHDSMTLECRERVVHAMKTFGGVVITRIDDPSVRLHQNGWAEIFVGVPPIRWTRGGATCAENTLVKTIQTITLDSALVHLFLSECQWSLLLNPWLDRCVLSVEEVHVRNQILNHKHMWKRVDLGALRGIRIDFTDTSQGVLPADIHRTRSADSFTATSSEGERWIHFVLDLDQRVENHSTALVEIDVELLHGRLCSWSLRIEAVDFEGLDTVSGLFWLFDF